MGAELLSVLVLGEAREVLGVLRKNQRFALWSHSHLEHELIREVKSVRSTVRAGSVSGRLDVGKVLTPFLQVIRSPEASGLITGVTLAAVERIITHGISDESASLSGIPDALREVIEAVAHCRFDPTDAAVDEKALTWICRVVLTTLTCSPWGDTMSDYTVLLGFETVLHIIGGRRRSELLKSVARQTLCAIIVALTRRIETVTQDTHPDQNLTKLQNELDVQLLSEPADPLLIELQQSGIFNFSFKSESASTEPYYTSNALNCILRLSSFIVDPMACASGSISPDNRLLGFSLLNAVICSASSTLPTPLMAIRSIRRGLLRETSRAVLRSLGASLTEPTRTVSVAFTTALNLLHALGPCGGPFLATMLQKVFPPYVTGRVEVTEDASSPYGGTSLDENTREIGLEALGALFAQPGLLAVAYASIDCNLAFANAVEPLLASLRLMVEGTGSDGWRTHRDSSSGDDSDEDIIRVNRAAALVCADTLINAMDAISDRVKTVSLVDNEAYRASSQSRGLDIETVDALRARKLSKDRRLKVVQQFNASKGKKAAGGLLALMRNWRQGTKDTVDSDPSVDEMNDAVQFLRYTPKLDKTAIGVVLGDPSPLSIRMLREYTATFQFCNRSFTAALRIFLESFRLPGEAQKIDRIMHEFAHHFYEENKELYLGLGTEPPLRSPDSAYVLAFAVVMLNTDLHNHSVRKKMTLDDFARNNRGCNDEQDFPRDFLKATFESILAVEIKMSDEAGIGFLTDIHWDEALRAANFLATSVNSSPNKMFLLTCPDDAKVFDEEVFKICWQPSLTAAVVALEESQEPVAAQAALEGFLSVARCGSSFRMTKCLNACLAALSSATLLLEGSLQGAVLRFGTNVKAQMATVALLGVARQCGDWIREPGWHSLIACVLRLHALCLLPDSLESRFYGYGDEMLMPSGEPPPQSKLMPVWWPQHASFHGEPNVAAGTDSIYRRRKRATGFLNAMGGLLRVGVAKWDNDDGDDEVLNIGGTRCEVSRYPPSYLQINDPDHFEAKMLAKKCIAECRVEEILISETRFLRSEALSSVAKAIGSAADLILSGEDWTEPSELEELSGKLKELTKSPKVSKTSIPVNQKNLKGPVEDFSENPGGEIEHEMPLLSQTVVNLDFGENGSPLASAKDDKKTRESVAAFCVDLLCQLTLRNRDRMGITWPYTYEVIVRIIGSATTPSVLLERAILSLFRISARYLHRDEVRSDVLKALNLIVKIPLQTAVVMSGAVITGIYHTVKAHSIHVTESSYWHTILSLIETGVKSPDPAPAIGFETLRYLLSPEVSRHALNEETFAPFLKAVSGYTNSDLATPTAALDLLADIAGHVDMFVSGIKEEASHETPSSAWANFWEPLLRVFAESARDSNAVVRNYALLLLERVISSGASSHAAMTPLDWQLAFQEVLFPLLKETFSPEALSLPDASSEEFQKTKLRSIILVGKTFLQHHSEIARGLSQKDFTTIWEGVLESFSIAYTSCEDIKAERTVSRAPSNLDEGASALMEHIPESAKNIVLVMASSGLLRRSDEGTMWKVTCETVTPWVPDIAEIVEAAETGSSVFVWTRNRVSPKEPEVQGDAAD